MKLLKRKIFFIEAPGQTRETPGSNRSFLRRGGMLALGEQRFTVRARAFRGHEDFICITFYGNGGTKFQRILEIPAWEAGTQPDAASEGDLRNYRVGRVGGGNRY